MWKIADGYYGWREKIDASCYGGASHSAAAFGATQAG
jgi:hypothetical protein